MLLALDEAGECRAIALGGLIKDALDFQSTIAISATMDPSLCFPDARAAILVVMFASRAQHVLQRHVL